MAIKIIKKKADKSVVKKCVCRNCGVKLEYTPKDVQIKFYSDYGGGKDQYDEFNCPNCGKLLQIPSY